MVIGAFAVMSTMMLVFFMDWMDSQTLKDVLIWFATALTGESILCVKVEAIMILVVGRGGIVSSAADSCVSSSVLLWPFLSASCVFLSSALHSNPPCTHAHAHTTDPCFLTSSSAMSWRRASDGRYSLSNKFIAAFCCFTRNWRMFGSHAVTDCVCCVVVCCFVLCCVVCLSLCLCRASTSRSSSSFRSLLWLVRLPCQALF